MARPQPLLRPIRPSKAEASDISDLRAILRQWLIAMPERARQRAAEAAGTPTDEASAEASPWMSAFAVSMPDGTQLTLPPSIARGLFMMLSALAEGDAVTVVPMGTDLTTQEAANLLGVSRPYLIRLIDQGLLPCEWVGTHRRVRVEDILAYRRLRQDRRRRALERLTEETERMGLPYSDGD